MKTIVSTIALVSAMSTAAFAGVQNTFTVDADGSVGIQTVHTLDVVGPSASEGLYLLATTGSGDVRAEEGFGKSYHHTGGKPGAFTYEIDTPWMAAAEALLGEGEFLAPHFLVNWSGDIDIMVAPHLLVDGKVMHGAGPDDSFIRISADRVNAFYSSSVVGAEVSAEANGDSIYTGAFEGSTSVTLEGITVSGELSFVEGNGVYNATGVGTVTGGNLPYAEAVDFVNTNADAIGELAAGAIDTYIDGLSNSTVSVSASLLKEEGGKADLIVSISGAKRFDYSDDIAK